MIYTLTSSVSSVESSLLCNAVSTWTPDAAQVAVNAIRSVSQHNTALLLQSTPAGELVGVSASLLVRLKEVALLKRCNTAVKKRRAGYGVGMVEYLRRVFPQSPHYTKSKNKDSWAWCESMGMTLFLILEDDRRVYTDREAAKVLLACCPGPEDVP